MTNYYLSIGEFLGERDGFFCILTDSGSIGLPDFLYRFWDEFTDGIEVKAARAAIIEAYDIDDEIFEDMINSLVLDGLLKVTDVRV